ncbi:MAG TPA: uroporphyrinogen decarboxylase [Stellaceae bacterium]|nr:uroporphyrinogen decarboxylase [Stellaceae bacterium]
MAAPVPDRNRRKPLLRVLSGERVTPPPVWLMRQAGRYLPEYRALREQAASMLDLCLAPDLAVEATLQPIRRYALDAAILFSDILVVPHALGQPVAFREGEGPVLTPLSSSDQIAALDPRRLGEGLAPVYETVRRLAQLLPAGVVLIGFAGAPWTVATYMVEGGSSRDFQRTKLWAYGDPTRFGALIDRLVEATAAHLLHQIGAGAEAVQLFDSWAGVLPESEFRQWVIEPTRRIVELVRARYPAVPIIGFPRGAGALYESYLRETGVDAVSLDTSVPWTFARERLQTAGPVQGNLDPVLLVAGGDALHRATEAMLRALSAGPYIANLGHGVVPQTPPEHVAQFVELVRRG